MPQATVTPGVPALLQPGYYVQFSDSWPGNLSVTYQDKKGATRGIFAQISRTNQVPYDLSYIIPSGDFRDVDFSNLLSTFNENLYPQNPITLYQTQIGFKRGNFLAIRYIPAGEYVSRLEQANMVPNVTSATLRYLGAIKWQDSPYYDKRFYFYSVYNMEPFILRLFVDNGVDFEKVVMGLTINKCYMNVIDPDKVTDEMRSRSLKIEYYLDERW
jgi:hypothetical protein